MSKLNLVRSQQRFNAFQWRYRDGARAWARTLYRPDRGASGSAINSFLLSHHAWLRAPRPLGADLAVFLATLASPQRRRAEDLAPASLKERRLINGLSTFDDCSMERGCGTRVSHMQEHDEDAY